MQMGERQDLTPSFRISQSWQAPGFFLGPIRPIQWTYSMDCEGSRNRSLQDGLP
jgi:hypothetical protein